MKKVVAIALSVLLIFSLLPMAAFAGSKSDEVQAKIVAARDYLYSQKDAFTAAESYDFLLFLLADGDGSAYKDAYVQSVKDAFDAGTMNTADRLGLAAWCLDLLGIDFKDFELNNGSKIDLEDKMMDIPTTVDSPYNYFFITLLCQRSANAKAADAIAEIEDALKSDYTMGEGYNYWGFATDNTATYAAVESLINGEDETIADAQEVVDKAKTEQGYYYTEQYGTDANGNSTATVLFMQAVLKNGDKADEVYQLLVNNFSAANGSFAYELGGEPSTLATRDALKAFIFYDASIDPGPEPETTTQPATEETTAAGDSKQSTPATGDSLVACGIAGAAVLAIGLVLVTRKKEEK